MNNDLLSWDVVMAQSWMPPERLNTFVGVHPRLFLSGDKLAHLKQKISSVHREIWAIIFEKADEYLNEEPPSDYNSENEMRRAGRGVPWQALAYRLTGEKKYLAGAKLWVLTICGFPHWERDRSLSGGECLFGVAIGYDWLYDKFSADERALIRRKLVHQATLMVDTPPVHHDRWLANHNHVEHLGLAAAGFALYDEVPEAVDWIGQADRVFETFFAVASDDGSSTEGHQYWAYTTEAVLRYAELARELLGVDYYGSSWLKSVAEFVIHSMLPDFGADNCVMSFGDSHRTFHSHGPTHILFRLAAEYRNGHAQWLAEQMLQRQIGRGDYCTWADLLWYDESVQPTPLGQLPTFWHCEDIGWVTSRSRWNDDSVMVGFKCGPMHGHKAQAYYDNRANGEKTHEVGGGHGHPDVASFQIYAYSKWLAIDPEYEKPKWTKNHNTILANGRGQYGEGQTWFDRDAVMNAGASSAIVKAESHADYDYVVGDAETIYPESTGLTGFCRHFVYIKPDVIVIVDVFDSNRGVRFDWLLHTEVGFEECDGGRFLAQNGTVGMDVHLLLPDEIQCHIEDKCLRASFDSDLFVTVLHPRRLDQEISRAQLISSVGELAMGIGVGERKMNVNLDCVKQEAKVLFC